MIQVFRTLLIVFFLALALPAGAQKAPATDASITTDASRRLEQAERDVRAVDAALDTQADADARRILRARATAAQQVTTAISASLTEQLGLLDARITGLGAAKGGESQEIRLQRGKLTTERAALDASIKRSGLIGIEAGQLIDELNRSEARQFARAVSAQVPSPLSPAFWQAVLTAAPRDFRRIGVFLDEGGAQIDREWRGGMPWPALGGVLLALLLVLPVRVGTRKLAQRFLIEGAPGHRVRRSAYAIWRVLTGTLSPLLAAIAIVAGMRWSGLLPARWSDLLDTFVVAAGFAGFTAAVLGAMLMRSQPSWRVIAIDTATATRLWPMSWMLATLEFAAILLKTFNKSVGASPAATTTTEAVIAILHIVLFGTFLRALGSLREELDSDNKPDGGGRIGLGLIELLLWLAILSAGGAILIGYVGLGSTITGFVAWFTVLGSATYLLITAIDDLVTSLFSRGNRFGQVLSRGLGFRGGTIDQVGLILSGLMRGVVVVLAIGLLFSPFGAGGGLSTLFGRLGTLAQGIEVGGVSISPGAILRGIIVLFIGLALVRAFMRWLDNRYLPVTDLDGSGRNSVSMIARYVGVVLATIWALASLGIGIERIALLLSALSVGIGFGLQAITQNFISGLILLAERPIKIGDLIRIGDDEGDVKRISVRSTEIELPDHSTLIVPNSELITKSVLNKTLSSPLGRVQIQFSVPIDVNPGDVRQIILDAFDSDEAVLDTPAPSVFIDSITDGLIVFKAFAHVNGPRAAYRARSNVFMTLLSTLHDRGIAIGTGPQRLELVSGDLGVRRPEQADDK